MFDIKHVSATIETLKFHCWHNLGSIGYIAINPWAVRKYIRLAEWGGIVLSFGPAYTGVQQSILVPQDHEIML